MRSALILASMVLGFFAASPVLADGAGAAVNITGGSEASQDCVKANDCFDPGTISVARGTVVTWTNIDITGHTVTSGSPSGIDAGKLFDSGQIPPGGTYSFLFMTGGRYNYFCSIHPWMTGVVIVSGPPPGNAGVTVPEFGPAAALVLSASVLFTAFLGRHISN